MIFATFSTHLGSSGSTSVTVVLIGVEWVVGTLRNGNQEFVRTIVPGSPENVVNTHHYQAMYYPDGSYAGINELVFNFKPWLDWYR
mgnify:CR=1 FL=1